MLRKVKGRNVALPWLLSLCHSTSSHLISSSHVISFRWQLHLRSDVLSRSPLPCVRQTKQSSSPDAFVQSSHYNFPTLPAPSRIQIPRDRAPQPPPSFSSDTDQILQVIPRRNAKLPDEVLRRTLKISILLSRYIILWPSEVRITADGLRPLEALQTSLRFSLSIWIERRAAEELI
jgi:hypothetical protein